MEKELWSKLFIECNSHVIPRSGQFLCTPWITYLDHEEFTNITGYAGHALINLDLLECDDVHLLGCAHTHTQTLKAQHAHTHIDTNILKYNTHMCVFCCLRAAY